MKNQFTEMHAAMKALVEKQERDGWQSPEVERCSKRLLKTLWMCANNEMVPQSVIQGLAEDTEALAKARQQFPTI